MWTPEVFKPLLQFKLKINHLVGSPPILYIVIS